MERLTTLPAGHVFVFGSNTDGKHAGGAAADAVRHFGAVWGQAVGLQGQAYAIPTVDYKRRDDFRVPLAAIRRHVLEFLRFASEHPELTFHVTPVGCGIAGYRVEDLAPLFRGGEAEPRNVVWPEEFVAFWRRQSEGVA
ncbi:MAG: hypothetical protein K1X87_12050 [Dehalococcoidia bacterium]|nr:hypothetical protein [Dehalococcoidia bacterium]